jgi:hypothetical protein
MSTIVDGTTGVSLVQDGVVVQADLAANVVGNGPVFRAYANAQTTVTSAFNKINLGAESFDTNNAFDTTLSRFTPQIAGYYAIHGSFEANGSSYSLRSYLYKNGVGVAAGTFTGSPMICSVVSDVIYLNGTTDYVELWGFSATSQPTNAASTGTFLTGSLVRAA